MNEIRTAIKCTICELVMQSPVSLPCGHSVCKHHTRDCSQFRCPDCGCEHPISSGDAFPLNFALARIISSNIEALSFGRVHAQAQKSCEHLYEVLAEVENLVADPSNYFHMLISGLKNKIDLKCEELKLKIDEATNTVRSKLDDYESKCKINTKSATFCDQVYKLNEWKETVKCELDSWTSVLNELKIDEDKWKEIKSESDKRSADFESRLKPFKSEILLMNEFDYNTTLVDSFTQINIDFKLEFGWLDIESKILSDDKKWLLVELTGLECKKAWSLLYRASRDGFKSDDFHSNCDCNYKTLTIVQTTCGFIFGGYTEAIWNRHSFCNSPNECFRNDNKAFLFSLVSPFEKPLKIPISRNVHKAINCFREYGPTFGCGYDLHISNNSNSNKNSYSNLGGSFCLQSEAASEYNNCLTKWRNFQVSEIEVFKIP